MLFATARAFLFQFWKTVSSTLCLQPNFRAEIKPCSSEGCSWHHELQPETISQSGTAGKCAADRREEGCDKKKNRGVKTWGYFSLYETRSVLKFNLLLVLYSSFSLFTILVPMALRMTKTWAIYLIIIQTTLKCTTFFMYFPAGNPRFTRKWEKYHFVCRKIKVGAVWNILYNKMRTN